MYEIKEFQEVKVIEGEEIMYTTFCQHYSSLEVMFKGKHDLIFKQQILQRGILSMDKAIETENFFGVLFTI